MTSVDSVIRRARREASRPVIDLALDVAAEAVHPIQMKEIPITAGEPETDPENPGTSHEGSEKRAQVELGLDV